MVPPGQRVKLVDIAAGRALTHRLIELGLTPGTEVQVMQQSGGPMMLAVRDTRLAVGRGVANKITVQEI